MIGCNPLRNCIHGHKRPFLSSEGSKNHFHFRILGIPSTKKFRNDVVVIIGHYQMMAQPLTTGHMGFNVSVDLSKTEEAPKSPDSMGAFRKYATFFFCMIHFLVLSSKPSKNDLGRKLWKFSGTQFYRGHNFIHIPIVHVHTFTRFPSLSDLIYLEMDKDHMCRKLF